MQIHPELHFPQIKNLELIASQVVKGYIIGKHKSPYHGFAVEFAEHKQYNPGDPIRHIDWKLYAKSGKLYSKKYEQETNLNSNICIDISSSMTFSENQNNFSKLTYALISAACMVYILKAQVDTTALTLFDDEIVDYLPNKSNHRHYQTLYNKLENLLQYRSSGKGTDFDNLFEFVSKNSRKNGLIMFFTDFLGMEDASQLLKTKLKELQYLGHEVLIFHLMDSEKELNFEYENRPYKFVDVETGESITTNPHAIREDYLRLKNEELAALKELFIQHKMRYHPIDIHQSFAQVLQPFFAINR